MYEEKIYEWFQKKGIDKLAINQNKSDNYLEVGFLDSLGFLELITMCENTFEISFTDDDFLNDEIFSIAGLVNIVKEKATYGK